MTLSIFLATGRVASWKGTRGSPVSIDLPGQRHNAYTTYPSARRTLLAKPGNADPQPVLSASVAGRALADIMRRLQKIPWDAQPSSLCFDWTSNGSFGIL